MDRKKYIEQGIDIDSALHRFLNKEDVYILFLKKFLADSSYQELISALEENDIEQAFMAAHTLKGVAGNLAMTQLYDAVYPLVEKLRHSDTDHLEDYIQPVSDSYQQLTTFIRAL